MKNKKIKVNFINCVDIRLIINYVMRKLKY